MLRAYSCLRFFHSVPFSSATLLALCSFASFAGFLFLNEPTTLETLRAKAQYQPPVRPSRMHEHVHHAGPCSDLEDQCCDWNPADENRKLLTAWMLLFG